MDVKIRDGVPALHEFSTAQSIVRAVLDVAEANRAKKVIEVEVEIGGLTHLSEEQLRFSFSILTRGTLLDKTRIRITYLPAIVRCRSCGLERRVHMGPLEIYSFVADFKCEKCAGSEAEIDGDTSCTLRSIRVKK